MIRIVAGTLKGRRLCVPRGGAVRPTANKVREALFGILGDRVRGARVLDAYAGSGALGFEALSRGAAVVTFLEADRELARAIETCAETFGVSERADVRRVRVVDAVRGKRLAAPYDLVLADPPWDSPEARELLAAVPAGGLLGPDGLLVVEGPSRRPPEAAPATLELFREARYGDSALRFYRPL